MKESDSESVNESDSESVEEYDSESDIVGHAFNPCRVMWSVEGRRLALDEVKETPPALTTCWDGVDLSFPQCRLSSLGCQRGKRERRELHAAHDTQRSVDSKIKASLGLDSCDI